MGLKWINEEEGPTSLLISVPARIGIPTVTECKQVMDEALNK
jgi:hypothetical protein